MKCNRYDRQTITAQRNADGHLYDTPVITRTGVFDYKNPDGTIRRELRLPEEVFNADSLASLRGVPITNGHVGRANTSNTRGNIGAVLSIGRQDGDNLIADIVIHDTKAIDDGNVELSCGYECDLEEKAGVWGGQSYDAIQRNIRHNHLAIVPKGRAGNARLNLDAADFDESASDNPKPKEINMKKIRLDNGLEYDAAPEVVAAYEQLKQDAEEATKAKDQAEAQRDLAKADLKKLQDEQEEYKNKAKAEAKARAELEKVAEENGVDVKEDAADRDIKIAIIGKLRADGLDLTGKSDDYVQAIFDDAIAKRNTQRADANAASQRAQTKQDSANQDGTAAGSLSAAAAREKMIERLEGNK